MIVEQGYSSIKNNYNELSPLSPSLLLIIGHYLLIVFMISLAFNSALIWLFIKNKDLRTFINIFIASISINNLVGSTVLPLVIHSCFNFK